MDSKNMGPTDITLILHEFGHWISALIFTFQIPKMTFDFEAGSGFCTHASTFFIFKWIICIMGAGFQNIIGACIFRISKPKGFGYILRAIGLTLYIVGWFDLAFNKEIYISEIHSYVPADFAENTIPKLILFFYLNYHLIWHVMAKTNINGSYFYQEFMTQAGYKKRSDIVIPPCKEDKKGKLSSFSDEFLYQSGIRKRPY
ncbi:MULTISPECIES: hypothetical protein [unclassified Oceanispirochaeta]|nr:MULTISPECIES: hypothetical protein [unclassified Oceanispirochaeta]MBF9018892.1 hypothetical protein [Oceanispirochaeta sp. M2]NPD75391.1 hypothetical protein [Oceanispirochaeta sp. M1]